MAGHSKWKKPEIKIKQLFFLVILITSIILCVIFIIYINDILHCIRGQFWYEDTAWSQIMWSWLSDNFPLAYFRQEIPQRESTWDSIKSSLDDRISNFKEFLTTTFYRRSNVDVNSEQDDAVSLHSRVLLAISNLCASFQSFMEQIVINYKLSKFILISILTCIIALISSYITYLLWFRNRKYVKPAKPRTKLKTTASEKYALSKSILGVRGGQKLIRPRLMITLVVILAACISIPWEFIRLYQIEVAKKAAVVIPGAPSDCWPHKLTWYESLKTWFIWQFSWDHSPCEEYHKALLVDPFWEVTPMLVLSSLVTRCIVTPIEMISSGIGRSLRLLFAEIPLPWQPIIMVILTLIIVLILLMVFSYRLRLPFFLLVEPRTPVCGRVKSRRKVTAQYCEGCVKKGDHIHAEHNVNNVHLEAIGFYRNQNDNLRDQ